jgi:cell division septation protein DedD
LVAEGETQYNIPVSSKQLIVYFVFLVIALSAAFLAGVMVGRNVDSSPEATVRDIQDDRLPEEPAASPTPDALTYGSTLQSEKIEGLAPSSGSSPTPVSSSRPAPASSALPKATPALAPSTRPTPEPPRSPSPAAARAPEKSTPKPTVKATPRPTPQPKAAPKATPPPKSQKSSPPPLNRLTIQVGAFKERAAAEAIVKRLKGKGYSAYLVPVSEGLFNVRVGSFTDREDAERVLTKLETQEKFKPFIVKP